MKSASRGLTVGFAYPPRQGRGVGVRSDPGASYAATRHTSKAPTPLKLGVDPVKLEASVCRSSFWWFVKRFWNTVLQAKPPVWNWHMEFISNELQEMAERLFKGEKKTHDAIFNIPPGTSKTTLISIMFPAWCWTRDPKLRFMCTSHTFGLSMKIARKSRDLIESEKYRTLFPGLELRDDANMLGYFINQHGGARFSTSTGSKVAGDHADAVIFDDPVDPTEAHSMADLEAANRHVCEALPSRMADQNVGIVIGVQQRVHQDDPSAHYMELALEGGGEVRHIKLPAEIIRNPLEEVKPRCLAKKYVDGLLDPIRLPREVLKKKRAILGEFGYAGQYLQNPVPIGGGMFKVDRLNSGTRPPSHPSDWKQMARFWDKAGSNFDAKKKRAYTAGVLMGLDRWERFWILDVVRGQWESAAREKVIRETAESDRHKYPKVRLKIGVEQEPGSGGKESAQNTIRRTLLGFTCEAIRPSGDKEQRADPYSVQVNEGRVYLADGPWVKDYKAELELFNNGSWVDQVDASSGAFEMLTRKRTKIGVW